jgi:hypothetical protein
MTFYLNKYVNYLKWVEDHFTVSSYFEYETHMPNIEEYILGLDIFSGQEKKSWNDTFGIEFQDWNRCHYLVSDISGISAQLPSADRLAIAYDSADGPDIVPVISKTTDTNGMSGIAAVLNSLSRSDQQFLQKNSALYTNSCNAIDELVGHKIMPTRIPIKLQTMMEKRRLIRNFDQCVEVYNNWVAEKGIGDAYTHSEITQSSMNEIGQWHAMSRLE